MAAKEEKHNDEIDFIELIKAIWSKKKFILITVGIFLILGIFFVFTSKTEFRAICKLLPEQHQSSQNKLKGLAGLAGINLNISANADKISPSLYPEIVSSASFLKNIIYQEIFFEKLDIDTTLIYYLNEVDRPDFPELLKAYTIGLPSRIINMFVSKRNTSNSSKMTRPKKEENDNINVLELNRAELASMGKLRRIINLEIDESDLISLTVDISDRIAAAMLGQLIIEELTKKISEYKLRKMTNTFTFISEQYKIKKSEYEKKQDLLVNFADRNRNLNTSKAKVEYDRLQNEVSVAFEVYSGLATQLEQIKIKIEEETPLFSIIDPITIPLAKHKPNEVFILTIFILLGTALSIVIVLTQHFIQKT